MFKIKIPNNKIFFYIASVILVILVIGVIVSQTSFFHKTTVFFASILGIEAELTPAPGLLTCQDLWWYDSQHNSCQQPKPFCGAYMYQGLQTFSTNEECETALNPIAIGEEPISITPAPGLPICQTLWWLDNTNKICNQKQFCGAYMYQGLRTFGTKEGCESALNPAKCESIIDNGPNTIKLIIVSDGYNDYNVFNADVINFIQDWFLKVEPYKSYNKFFSIYKLKGNFGLGCGYYEGDSKYNCTPETVIKLADYCPFKDKQTDFLVMVGDPQAHPGTCFNYYYNDTTLPDFPWPLVRNSMMSHSRTGSHALHEYTHCYGIEDEYFKIDWTPEDGYFTSTVNCDKKGCPKWCSGTINTSNSCYDAVQEFQKCILTNSYLDCIKQSADFEKYIFTCDIGVNCNGGVGCFYGCGSTNGYKELKYSLMGLAYDEGDRYYLSPNTKNQIIKIIGERTSISMNPSTEKPATTTLLKSESTNEVYEIIDNRKLWIPTAETFNNIGYKWTDIQDKTEIEINQYPRIKLVKTNNSPKVYYLTESGLKRWIPNEQIFVSYNNKWEDIVEVSDSELNAYPDNVLIKLENNPMVYKLENNQKRWITTAEAFNRLKYDWTKIAPINQVEFDYYPESESIN